VPSLILRHPFTRVIAGLDPAIHAALLGDRRSRLDTWKAGPNVRCEARTMKTRKRCIRPVGGPICRVPDEVVPRDNAPANETNNPFAVFSEWSSEADEKSYRNL
jgi:hypothetical protein